MDISINLEPASRGRGLGPAVIRQATARLFRAGVDTVVAEIKKENSHSVRAFEKAGYRFLDAVDKTVEDTGEVVPIFRLIAQRPADGEGPE